MTHEEREQMWTQRVTDYQTSGLSKKAWSKRNGISRGSLSNWLNKLSTQGIPTSATPKNFHFVNAIVSIDRNEKTESTITIQIGNAEIKIGDEFNKDTLRSVVQIVNDIC